LSCRGASPCRTAPAFLAILFTLCGLAVRRAVAVVRRGAASCARLRLPFLVYVVVLPFVGAPLAAPPLLLTFPFYVVVLPFVKALLAAPASLPRRRRPLYDIRLPRPLARTMPPPESATRFWMGSKSRGTSLSRRSVSELRKHSSEGLKSGWLLFIHRTESSNKRLGEEHDDIK